jgi:phage gp46-like protein
MKREGRMVCRVMDGENNWNHCCGDVRWGEAGLAQDMDLVSAFLFTPDMSLSSLDAAALEA